jgi:hypothetical protein
LTAVDARARHALEEKMTMTSTAAAADGQRQRGVFDVDEDRALAELELAWAAGGYHGFSADSGTWCAITGAGDVLTGDTPDALATAIRAHWQAMQ